MNAPKAQESETSTHMTLDDSEQPSCESSSPTQETTSTIIPKELLELEDVDMDSETMDSLEWATRKIISIPKEYYWNHPEVNSALLPVKLKVWHRSVGAMGTLVHAIDYLGMGVANFLGLTSSRFAYVTSTMTEQDWELSRTIVQERRHQQQEEAVEKGD
jgi:hypothetical protein